MKAGTAWLMVEPSRGKEMTKDGATAAPRCLNCHNACVRSPKPSGGSLDRPATVMTLMAYTQFCSAL